MNCLLCGSANVRISRSFSTKVLKQKWINEFHYDISNDIESVEILNEFTCQSCRLQFFNSTITPCNRLYETLEKFDWYYLNEKWEYLTGVSDISPNDKVLELGSGRGLFLEKLIKFYPSISVHGLELNVSAVDHAIQKGISVENRDFYEIDKNEQQFTVICAFQVLEHLKKPVDFFSKACDLLRTDGKLILAVPNGAGWQMNLELLLDLPPHHFTIWTKETFEYLCNIYPLKIEKVLYEPLPNYHFSLFLSSLIKKGLFLKIIPLKFFLWFGKNILNIVNRYFPNSLLPNGMGMYILLTKN